MKSIGSQFLEDFVLLVVLIGCYYLIRFLFKKKDEAIFRRWHSWILLILFGTFILLSRSLSPTPQTNELPGYSIFLNDEIVPQSENTELKIDGNNSFLVVDIQGKTANLKVIPKSPVKQVLGKVFPLTQVSAKEFYQGGIDILHFPTIDEYYIVILSIGSEGLTVSDNHGSSFQEIKVSPATLDASTYRYCACVGSLDDSYILTINGSDIHLR